MKIAIFSNSAKTEKSKDGPWYYYSAKFKRTSPYRAKNSPFDPRCVPKYMFTLYTSASILAACVMSKQIFWTHRGSKGEFLLCMVRFF